MKRALEIDFLEILKTVEKRSPFICLIEPALPLRFELFFDCLGKPPKRDAIGRVEDFVAPMGCDRADGACLRKMVSSGKASADRRSPERAELPSSIPPLSEIHFAKPGND